MVEKMNKKNVAWIYIMMLSIGTILSLYIPKQESVADETIVIPQEAVRLRILANSDTQKDQAIKRKVRDEVNKEITRWVESLTSIEDAREVIQSHLGDIQMIAERVVKEENSKQSVKVEFGQVQFPTKLYGQFLYPAGKYEAVLITLGKGDGANWWCVLYPPLCFLDFSNGVAVSPGFDSSNEEKKKSTERIKENAETQMKENNQQKNVENVDIEKDDSKNKDNEDKSTEISKKKGKNSSTEPLYVKDNEDEDDVKVKFFIVELFEKVF
jgi:stage II sporulation protein R